MQLVAQPTFVPVADADRVRPSIPAPVPVKARANRPGELRKPGMLPGRGRGTTGPDQGYALTLAHRLAPRLHLAEHEDRHDVALGIALLGAKRAALAGRAPCTYDLDVAAGLFGFLAEAPYELVAFRRHFFEGLAHSYAQQRRLTDAVTPQALRLSPEATRDPEQWRERLELP
jgi:hypothetical protein